MTDRFEDVSIHGASGFPPSLTPIVAIALLIVGVFVAASLFLRVGPFA